MVTLLEIKIHIIRSRIAHEDKKSNSRGQEMILARFS